MNKKKRKHIETPAELYSIIGRVYKGQRVRRTPAKRLQSMHRRIKEIQRLLNTGKRYPRGVMIARYLIKGYAQRIAELENQIKDANNE